MTAKARAKDGVKIGAKLDYEQAAIKVLSKAKTPLSIAEIMDRIIEQDLVKISGKTPRSTLYSVIFKKERTRKKLGKKAVFKKVRKGNSVLYRL